MYIMLCLKQICYRIYNLLYNLLKILIFPYYNPLVLIFLQMLLNKTFLNSLIVILNNYLCIILYNLKQKRTKMTLIIIWLFLIQKLHVRLDHILIFSRYHNQCNFTITIQSQLVKELMDNWSNLFISVMNC